MIPLDNAGEAKPIDTGVEDTVKVALIPVLLGDGVPLQPPVAKTTLTLSDHRVLPKQWRSCDVRGVVSG